MCTYCEVGGGVVLLSLFKRWHLRHTAAAAAQVESLKRGTTAVRVGDSRNDIIPITYWKGSVRGGSPLCMQQQTDRK